MMAIANPAPPPDGYYWFQPTDPGSLERIVQVRHSLDGRVEITFPGTDYVAEWGEREACGMFAPVAPAPWHPPQSGAGLHITGDDLVLLSVALRCLRLGMKPTVSMDVDRAKQLQNRLDHEHRAQLKARRT